MLCCSSWSALKQRPHSPWLSLVKSLKLDLCLCINPLWISTRGCCIVLDVQLEPTQTPEELYLYCTSGPWIVPHWPQWLLGLLVLHIPGIDTDSKNNTYQTGLMISFFILMLDTPAFTSATTAQSEGVHYIWPSDLLSLVQTECSRVNRLTCCNGCMAWPTI